MYIISRVTYYSQLLIHEQFILNYLLNGNFD